MLTLHIIDILVIDGLAASRTLPVDARTDPPYPVILAIGGLATSRTLLVDTIADPPYPRYTCYWWFGSKQNAGYLTLPSLGRLALDCTLNSNSSAYPLYPEDTRY